ncbi:MAG TPA: hypothetical protein VGO52_08640 [Hyphomonadaceae bacterium]|jgi:hypothetical protein|nr:hypothetical protein [Hyphomonadaceae bacterium]
MEFGFIIPAAIWLAAFLALAVVLFQASRKAEKEGRKSRHLMWMAAASLALGGAAIPAAIQFIATEGKMWWAGAPLAFIALALGFQSIRVERPKGPALATFREKSAAVSVAAILLIYGWATVGVLQAPLELEGAFGFLVGTSVMMIIVMALSHTVLAILREPEKQDERDKLVGWRSTRNGYVVMTVGVWAVLALVFAQAPLGVLAYALLGLFVLAELVRLASELVYYRLAV